MWVVITSIKSVTLANNTTIRLSLFTTLSAHFTFVYAHGRITNITTSTGTVYEGWDPEFAAKPPLPQLAAWSASNLGNIFVRPSRFNTSGVICHYDAQPVALHVEITAGDTLKLQWNEWPVSHVGPVLTYLAACNGSCSSSDKRALQWVKIDELGWLNSTGWDKIDLGGTWASNVLIANVFSWIAKLPDALAAGDYVLRHEIIALHVADQLDGAQAYPQCVNLRVAKGKSGKEIMLGAGVLGDRLYGYQDPGIFVDVHKKITGYMIPGPKLWDGATPSKQPTEKR